MNNGQELEMETQFVDSSPSLQSAVPSSTINSEAISTVIPTTRPPTPPVGVQTVHHHATPPREAESGDTETVLSQEIFSNPIQIFNEEPKKVTTTKKRHRKKQVTWFKPKSRKRRTQPAVTRHFQ